MPPMVDGVDSLPSAAGLGPGLGSAGDGASGVVEPSVPDPGATAGALSGELSAVRGGPDWNAGGAGSPALMLGRALGAGAASASEGAASTSVGAASTSEGPVSPPRGHFGGAGEELAVPAGSSPDGTERAIRCASGEVEPGPGPTGDAAGRVGPDVAVAEAGCRPDGVSPPADPSDWLGARAKAAASGSGLVVGESSGVGGAAIAPPGSRADSGAARDEAVDVGAPIVALLLGLVEMLAGRWSCTAPPTGLTACPCASGDVSPRTSKQIAATIAPATALGAPRVRSTFERIKPQSGITAETSQRSREKHPPRCASLLFPY
jgi:hypothetical protein